MAYVFNEDGTVEITYEGASSADVWEYTISDSTLTMKDTEAGSVLTYTKK